VRADSSLADISGNKAVEASTAARDLLIKFMTFVTVSSLISPGIEILLFFGGGSTLTAFSASLLARIRFSLRVILGDFKPGLKLKVVKPEVEPISEEVDESKALVPVETVRNDFCCDSFDVELIEDNVLETFDEEL
jgi:hypothetical protein